MRLNYCQLTCGKYFIKIKYTREWSELLNCTERYFSSLSWSRLMRSNSARQPASWCNLNRYSDYHREDKWKNERDWINSATKERDIIKVQKVLKSYRKRQRQRAEHGDKKKKQKSVTGRKRKWVRESEWVTAKEYSFIAVPVLL